MDQVGGDHSTNLQANRDINISGLTRDQARQMFMEMFDDNFYKLKAEAFEKATQRMFEITNKFLDRIYSINPDLSKKFAEPSVQASIYLAQQEYAKTGDLELEDRLLSVLVERIASDERSFKQIVLDEALKVLPKLTRDQISILTLIIFIHFPHEVRTRPQLIDFINRLVSFYPLTPLGAASISHLQYCGCCSVFGEGKYILSFPEVILKRYKGICNKGFTMEELNQAFESNAPELNGIVIKNVHDTSKLQIGFMDNESLKHRLEQDNLTKYEKQLQRLFDQGTMNLSEVKELLIEINPRMAHLIVDWAKSEFKSMMPTSVGYVIATINYNKVTGNKIPLDYFF